MAMKPQQKVFFHVEYGGFVFISQTRQMSNGSALQIKKVFEVLQGLKDFKKIEQKPIQSKSANSNFLFSEIFADIHVYMFCSRQM